MSSNVSQTFSPNPYLSSLTLFKSGMFKSNMAKSKCLLWFQQLKLKSSNCNEIVLWKGNQYKKAFDQDFNATTEHTLLQCLCSIEIKGWDLTGASYCIF